MVLGASGFDSGLEGRGGKTFAKGGEDLLAFEGFFAGGTDLAAFATGFATRFGFSSPEEAVGGLVSLKTFANEN